MFYFVLDFQIIKFLEAIRPHRLVSLLFFNFIPDINNYFSEISGQAKKGRRKKESRKNLFGSKMLELVLNFAAYESEDVAFEGRLAHFGDVASSGNNGNETF